MNNLRSKSTAFLFLVLFAVAVFFLYDRMIAGKEEISQSSYMDKRFITLMEGLIADNVFYVQDEQIFINEDVLKAKGLSKRTEERVRKSLVYLRIEKGKIVFDEKSVSVKNNRVLENITTIRGRFLDRNGIVLVESKINEKISKQERTYSYGNELYPIIGHYSVVYGKRHLEKVLDDYLMGLKHPPIYRDANEPFKKYIIGDNVFLTIDKDVQSTAYRLISDKKGAVVVIDINTGEIIAAVSSPSFDPSEKDDTKWREAFKPTQTAMSYKNRAFNVLYAPGSTFKTVTASAWLEANHSDKEYSTQCNGRKNRYGISDIHAHGKADLYKAYAESCNIFFSEMGVILGRDMAVYAKKFGFNRAFNLLPQLNGYNYDTSYSPAFVTYNNNGQITAAPEIFFNRNPKLVAQGAIGQNLVTATPLHMAVVASIIANNGILLNPYIVKEITTGDGENSVFKSTPVVITQSISPIVANKVRRMMQAVMISGTGKDVKRLFIENGIYTTKPSNKSNSQVVPIAGKTGTAELGDRNGNGKIDDDERPHSWFIGFAPADNPKVAVAVVAENMGFGSLTAAPIAIDVMAEALNRLKKIK